MLTVEQSRAEAQISRAKWYEMVRQGRGPRITKIDKLTRITPADQSAWIERLRQETPAALTR